MARAVRVGGVAAGSIAGAEEFQRLLKTFPQQVVVDTRQALNDGAAQVVSDIRAVAPVSTLEGRPGELRDSVHQEDGRHDLSVLVVEDARDAKGHAYPAHVEFGHKTPAGGHVPAQPHFWPAVRAGRRAIISKIRSSMRRAARGSA